MNDPKKLEHCTSRRKFIGFTASITAGSLVTQSNTGQAADAKASEKIYKLSDWPKNRDAYASKNIYENIKNHLINFLCKVPVNDIGCKAQSKYEL